MLAVVVIVRNLVVKKNIVNAIKVELDALNYANVKNVKIWLTITKIKAL